MACKKYTISNNGSSTITFNYRRCDDGMWEYQETLMVGEVKNVWFIPGTFSTASNNSIQITDDGTFPPQPLTPTPSASSVTPTVTPTMTQTPSETPTMTPTPTMTQTPSSTPPPPFKSIWSATTNGDTITLPLVSNGTYDFIVDWGDGSNIDNITQWDDVLTTHTYSSAGSYEVIISGIIEGFSVNFSSDRLKLLEITQWGCLKLGNNSRYFYGCSNLTLSNLTDTLNLTGTDDLSFMFSDCRSLDVVQNMEYWDVSNVTNMSAMFTNCNLFNHDISGWDVSLVQDMSYLFGSASVFNIDISSWNVSSVTNMNGMFGGTTDFNQDISGWDVSLVQNMSEMFIYSHFNQPLNSWGTRLGSVTTMNGMFNTAYDFNQPLDTWNVQYVQDMGNMFANATQFNQPLSAWNISYCTNFTDFMTGKDSSNYSTQNISTLLQSWSSQGLQPSVNLDFGNINVPIANLGYIATLTGSPNNWSVSYGQLIVEYDYGYDASTSGAACLTSLGVYWSGTIDFETGGSVLYSDASLTTIASAGYYSDGVNWFQVDGTGYVISSGSC